MIKKNEQSSSFSYKSRENSKIKNEELKIRKGDFNSSLSKKVVPFHIGVVIWFNALEKIRLYQN